MEKKLKFGLLYYSGTGSTAYFANYISNLMEEQGFSAKTHRITDKSQINFDQFDIIGIGGPVYMWTAPKILRDYIKRSIKWQKPFFIFGTCGGTPGNFPRSIYQKVAINGGIYLGQIIGRGTNNIRSWRDDLTIENEKLDHIFEQDLNSASKSIKDMIGNLISINSNDWNMLSQKPPKKYFKYSILGMFSSFRFILQKMVGNKKLNKEKCTQCRLCAEKICPSAAIIINSANYPEFKEKKCQGCQGCVNLCPTLAIETKSTKNKQPFTTYRKFITAS